jgi:hypothetical protein
VRDDVAISDLEPREPREFMVLFTLLQDEMESELATAAAAGPTAILRMGARLAVVFARGAEFQAIAEDLGWTRPGRESSGAEGIELHRVLPPSEALSALHRLPHWRTPEVVLFTEVGGEDVHVDKRSAR